MHVFFEDDGGFSAATLLDGAAAGASALQVELPSGRRPKIKSNQILLRFERPGPQALLDEAAALADTLDLDFLWEVAPQDEFESNALAGDYFGGAPNAVQQAALLLRLHGSPVYFRRRGKGRYRPATRVELDAALASIERKRRLGEWESDAAATLVAGRLPATRPDGTPGDWAERAPFLLHKPDRSTPEAQAEQKAIERAMHDGKASAAKLLLDAGAFASAHALHRSRFLVEWYPGLITGKSPGAPALGSTAALDKLPLATVEAFSIDDSETTEIDDALSVEWLGDGVVRIGVHIAAPGLVIRPGDPLDQWARKRMSTVYMPGEKIKMLPDAAVERLTLAEGGARPALSLYADFDLESGECRQIESRVERVPIAENLRHDQLDHLVTEAVLDRDLDGDGDGDADGEPEPEAELVPRRRELSVLWRIANHLRHGREQVRGKPEPASRADFHFRLDDAPDGGEPQVRIEQRRRDAPLDRIVAEFMIFANSTWGRRLHDAGVPAIYRVQTAPPRPGMRASSVRMTTAGDQHIGLGVSHYAWSSSPLRRYVDLVNQWQLLAVLQLQRPPFERGSADLFAIVGAFDAAYSAYAEIQSTMERYWCLRWLEQQGRLGTSMPASVLRNENARLAEIPLVSRLAGIGHVAPGTRIDVEPISTDPLELAVQLRLLAVHEEVPAEAEAAEAADDDAALDETQVDPEAVEGADATAAADAAATIASTSSQSVQVESPAEGAGQ